MMNFMRNQINAKRARSAWSKGVREYALELIENVAEMAEMVGEAPANLRELDRWMLNGASSWQQYSEGGCSLIYNSDIAQRLCTASELKKTRNGLKDPNARENWLDCQARALWQAAELVRGAFLAAQQILSAGKSLHSELEELDEIPTF